MGIPFTDLATLPCHHPYRKGGRKTGANLWTFGYSLRAHRYRYQVNMHWKRTLSRNKVEDIHTDHALLYCPSTTQLCSNVESWVGKDIRNVQIV